MVIGYFILMIVTLTFSIIYSSYLLLIFTIIFMYVYVDELLLYRQNKKNTKKNIDFTLEKWTKK